MEGLSQPGADSAQTGCDAPSDTNSDQLRVAYQQKACTCTLNDLLGAHQNGLVPEKMQLFAVFAHVANSRHSESGASD
jgi:hypothetical protein